MKLRNIIIIGLGLAGLFLIGAELVDRIVAVVGDEVITLRELEQAYQNDTLKIQKEDKKLTKKEYLERMIEKKLIEQEVKRAGVTVSAQELEQAIEKKRKELGLSPEEFRSLLRAQGITMEEYRQQVRENLVLARLLAQEVRSELEVSEQEIVAYYNQHKDEFRTPERVKLYHIVVHKGKAGQKKLKQIIREYQDGKGFTELARKYSEGEEASRGGELGWVELGQLKPELRKIIAPLQVGELSPIYEDEAGYHLFMVAGREKSMLLPLEQVREQIRQILYRKQFEEQYLLWLERLKAKTYIDIRL